MPPSNQQAADGQTLSLKWMTSADWKPPRAGVRAMARLLLEIAEQQESADHVQPNRAGQLSTDETPAASPQQAGR